MPLLAWLVPLCALRLQPHKRLPKASPSVPTWLDPESPAAPAHGKTPGGLPRWGQTLIPREMLSPPRSVYPPWDGCPCPLGLGPRIGALSVPCIKKPVETTVCTSAKKRCGLSLTHIPSSRSCSPSLCSLGLPCQPEDFPTALQLGASVKSARKENEF